MVLMVKDQSEQVHSITVPTTAASTNSVEPIKDTTKPEPETETKSDKAHLATLMTDAEEKSKKAVDVGIYAAKMAQNIAFDAEAAATEAEREYRKLIDSAVQNEEKHSQYIGKNAEIQDKIVSFTSLVKTVDDAHKEAKRAAISTEAAKEAWKHAEKKAWLFKTKALLIDGETDTVLAAAQGANIAATETSKAFSEYRKVVEKVKAAIENVETKSQKLSLSGSLLQGTMEKFKSTVKEAEKEMEQFQAAANLAKDRAADVAQAWLALSDISKQELEKKERKAVEMEDKEGIIQTGHYDFQQQKNKTTWTRWKKAYMLLFSLIITSSIGTVAYISLTNVEILRAQLVWLELGHQMVRSFLRGGPPEEGEEALLIQAARPEMVIELANLRVVNLHVIAEEQRNIAVRAALEARQAQNVAEAAYQNAVTALENARARLADAHEGQLRLVELRNAQL